MSNSVSLEQYKVPKKDMIHALKVAGAGDLNKSDFGFTGQGIDEDLLKAFLDPASDVAEKIWAPTNKLLHDKGLKMTSAADGGYSLGYPKWSFRP